jgi:xanthosine utilization system XapX-like protein
MKSFFLRNFSIYHIIGVILGFIFSFVYWKKAGQYSDYIVKNNLLLVSIWGILVGYIVFDLIKNAIKRKNSEK